MILIYFIWIFGNLGTNVANGSIRIWIFGIINPCAMCWHSRRGFFFWENDVPGNFRFTSVCVRFTLITFITWFTSTRRCHVAPRRFFFFWENDVPGFFEHVFGHLGHCLQIWTWIDVKVVRCSVIPRSYPLDKSGGVYPIWSRSR